MKNKKVIFFVSILFLLFLGVKVSSEEVPYGVSLNFPENQVNKKLNYFNLKMSPAQKQSVEMEVINTSNKDIEIDVRILSGMTNINGVIDYLEESKDFKYDETLKYPFTDIAKLKNNNYQIEANSSIRIPINIEMPTEKISGTILGGVEIVEKKPEETDITNKGMAVVNKFRYLVAFKLSMSDEVVEPKLKLNEVKASQIAFRNVIKANIQNTEMTIINDVQVDAKVTKKGSDKVLYSYKMKDMQIAPNSNFDLPIRLENQPFRAGTYILYLNVASRGGYKWAFKKEFIITSDEADKFNEMSAIELDKENSLLLYIIVSALILVAIVFFILIKRKRKNKKRKRRKKKRK
ncbi:DUF916 and DUF3324 domain-containing protein [Vagococcus fluvialis]|uniref:DUF916 and DUF3324 domain-containing protein n=1 Tax=Vagococcus fluvialis TaxID=2738 RepID=A0A7X6I3T2_9ENTE|nr:DUF916 and DUF3324 domain-containing protein [Vagococcus fluvialis]NKC68530.1 DUF916 and DUF3324 domain-containing protein [Vagococcus fluvialis]